MFPRGTEQILAATYLEHKDIRLFQFHKHEHIARPYNGVCCHIDCLRSLGVRKVVDWGADRPAGIFLKKK